LADVRTIHNHFNRSQIFSSDLFTPDLHFNISSHI
jgi:hypothetical protein